MGEISLKCIHCKKNIFFSHCKKLFVAIILVYLPPDNLRLLPFLQPKSIEMEHSVWYLL